MKIINIRDALNENLDEMFKNPVVIPTETVYGLAAKIDSENALNKIFEIKGRPKDNPLIIHISSYEMLYNIVDNDIPEEYKALMDKFWPGPLTLIFKSKGIISSSVKGSSSSNTIAVRMPKSKLLRSLIEKIGVPLAAPSANTSGKPSPTCIQHAIDDLNDKVEYYIDDGPCSLGLESTVFGVIDSKPLLLRPGFVTKENIEDILKCEIIVKTKANSFEPNICPGQKYRHYSPSIPVILFKGNKWAQNMEKEYSKYSDKKIGLMCISSPDPKILYFRKFFNGKCIKEYANAIFAGLRELDKECDVIFVQGVSLENEGMAIMDRLEKASSIIFD